MVNKVILIGNLGGDPEVRTLETANVVGRFSVATNENYKDKSGEWQTLTEWHTVVVWNKLAIKAEKSLKKGTPVFVEGKISTRSWTDKDGNNRKTTEIVASYFRSLAPKEGSHSTPMPGYQDAPEPIEPPAADDDLPF